MKITARVPATSANLGAGFDCLGLALELYNEVTVEPDAPPGIEIVGEGAEQLPRDESNLVYRTILRYFRSIGRPAPPFSLRLDNSIPLTGGMGSSSAALVGALLTANELAGRAMVQEKLLRLAAEIEGHPDNVAPALLGGLVVSVLEGERVIAVKLLTPPSLRALLFIPNFTMPTAEARRLLPKVVPHRDAVFNLSRTALWLAALQTGRLDLLRVATQDRLHQPYREKMFPGMAALFQAALEAGAVGACLSGAGSAVLVLTEGHSEAIIRGLQQAAQKVGVGGRVLSVGICQEGAQITRTE